MGLSRRAPAGLRDASVPGSGLQVPPAAGTAFLDVVRCSVAVHCSGSWGDWSACGGGSCGHDGTQTREYFVVRPRHAAPPDT